MSNGRGGRALLLVAAHVEVVVVGAAVGQPVDQPRVAVVGEDDRLVGGEERVEVAVGQAVRMLALRLQRHQVDDVDDADLQLGQVLAQQMPTAASVSSVGTSPAQAMHHVGLVPGRRCWPTPRCRCRRVQCGDRRRPWSSHCERGLLAGDDDVDVVAAAQAVVGDRQQRVGVGRQVDADDLGLLVDDVVDEAGVLVGEAVVVLPPDVRGQQVVERGDRPPPGDACA